MVQVGANSLISDKSLEPNIYLLITIQIVNLNDNKYCRRGRQYGLNRSVCRQNR